jgi:hypothetical protein
MSKRGHAVYDERMLHRDTGETPMRSRTSAFDETTVLLAIVLWLLAPLPAFSDVITPFSYRTAPLLAPIILVEAVLFQLLSRKRFKTAVRFWKSLGVVALANLASSLAGIVVPTYRRQNLLPVCVAFVLSVLIEWLVYLPFCRKSGLRRKDLFKISAVVNLATYIPLAVLMLW